MKCFESTEEIINFYKSHNAFKDLEIKIFETKKGWIVIFNDKEYCVNYKKVQT